MKKIYLDDLRIPLDASWIVVRNFTDFVNTIDELGGITQLELISLDHDLENSSMDEFFRVTQNTFDIQDFDHKNIHYNNGLTCLKWLFNQFYKKNPPSICGQIIQFEDNTKPYYFPKIQIHSTNSFASGIMIGHIEYFLRCNGISIREQAQNLNLRQFPKIVN